MGFPLAFIEILLVLICCPILFLVYYQLNKNTLRNTFPEKSIFIHFLVVLGIVSLGILLSNLVRTCCGITLSYLFTDSITIKQFASLLWVTPYENELSTTICASFLTLALNLIVTYNILRLYKSKSKYLVAEKNYSLYTTLIFNVPIIIYLFSQVILLIP